MKRQTKLLPVACVTAVAFLCWRSNFQRTIRHLWSDKIDAPFDRCTIGSSWSSGTDFWYFDNASLHYMQILFPELHGSANNNRTLLDLSDLHASSLRLKLTLSDRQAVQLFGVLYMLKRPHTTRDVIYNMKSTDAGFASRLNNALNAFLVALFTPAAANFRLVQTEWSYGKLTDFFIDPFLNTGCPMMTLSSSFSASGVSLSQFVSVNNTKPFVVARDNRVDWSAMRARTDELYKTFGYCSLMKRKRILAKLIWNLNPSIRELVELTKKHIFMNNSAHKFIGVHIRSGDKIVAHEMSCIPIESYIDAIANASISVFGKASSGKTIFVSSDDERLEERIEQEFKPPTWNVVRWMNVVRLERNELALQAMDGYYHGSLSSLSPSERHKRNVALIVAITVLADADRLICTYSSNVCRLVTLLRRDPCASGVHSVDYPVWYPL